MAAWLRAQVEADKAAALAVRDNSAPWEGRWQPRGTHGLETYNGWPLAIAGPRFGDFRPGVLEHIAIHDPRDVIADCDAKLAVLDLCERVIRDDAEDHDDCGAADSWTGFAVARLTVQLLASGYRHRDGWQEEWAA
jgi:hypothetical protein